MSLVSLETQSSLPSYIGHFIILMFSSQLVVSKHRIQIHFKEELQKPNKTKCYAILWLTCWFFPGQSLQQKRLSQLLISV